MNDRTIPKTLQILGTRGIPACHGGFETFAENFARYLVTKTDWNVAIYCQEVGRGAIHKDTWNGITRITIPVRWDNAIGTIVFDLLATWHACRNNGVCMTLGYNTAIFNILLMLTGKKTIMNMDGIEWSRQKWSFASKVWLYCNEFVGAKVSNLLVADHPEISKHLQRHTNKAKIRTIAYGSEAITQANIDILKAYHVAPHKYAIVIARAEPENSLLEIISAWSKEKRGIPLLVLGTYHDAVPYHKEVKDCASSEVHFLGAIYDSETVSALRLYSRFYLHGHQVGGTNPSLIEAMASRNAIIAHNNRFTRWVAGEGASYFNDIEECSNLISEFIANDELQDRRSLASMKRHAEHFTLDLIHKQYQDAIEEL